MLEWDPGKNQTNIKKHGVSFETAQRIFDGPVVSGADTREDYGEDRFVGIGGAAGAVLAVVYTYRGENTQLISARPATRTVREKYDEQIR